MVGLAIGGFIALYRIKAYCFIPLGVSLGVFAGLVFSKILDENCESKVVYHGTPNDNFEIFSDERLATLREEKNKEKLLQIL